MAAHSAVHSIQVGADPASVYRLVAHVPLWPVLFGPTINVDVLHREDGPHGTSSEQFRIHAMVAGSVRDWTSRRRLDPGRLTIEFEQEHSAPPLGAMGGGWTFQPTAGGTTIELTHRFTLTDDSPQSLQWVNGVLDTNSDRELQALLRAGGGPRCVEDLLVDCEDSVTVESDLSAYEFIARADRWAQLLPHVQRADLRELGEGVQDLTLITTTAGGETHRTRSIRLCTAPARIVYKQLEPPAGLMGHCGAWEFERSDTADSLTVTSRHTALLDPAALTPASDVGEIRARVAAALSANSRATLEHATRGSRVAAGSGR